MIVKPKCRGFICTTTHPLGCAKNVEDQVEYIKSQPTIDGVKRVLVLGSSTGYGLASRIAAAFGMGAATIGVFFDRPGSETKPGTAGYYNNKAFEEEAKKAGLYAKSLNCDAFSHEAKQDVINLIKNDMPGGKVDLVVYSLASPKRVDPDTGEVYNSVIKPIGSAYSSKTVDFHTGTVSDVTIEPAKEDEIPSTIAVMGGADWLLWIQALQNAGVLSENCLTTAFSYIGPTMTHAIYKNGTIGMAKLDLEKKAKEITELLDPIGGKAYVSVNKALVTQASSAIPVVPLYISILYKIMKQKGTHEGCIEQIYRLYSDRLYNKSGISTDEENRIRIDDLEMMPEIQSEVDKIWNEINSENIESFSDIVGYRKEFFNLFGFERDDVDYDADVDLL
ncbi:MAG: trans-2-enoyl-CoA reductase family protein [Bacillota bacterium]|nr:trans-2-enoyl-CoA reductase family protein [Bacillota bacterium]